MENEKSNFSPKLKAEIDRVAAMGEALKQHVENVTDLNTKTNPKNECFDMDAMPDDAPIPYEPDQSEDDNDNDLEEI